MFGHCAEKLLLSYKHIKNTNKNKIQWNIYTIQKKQWIIQQKLREIPSERKFLLQVKLYLLAFPVIKFNPI